MAGEPPALADLVLERVVGSKGRRLYRVTVRAQRDDDSLSSPVRGFLRVLKPRA